MQAFYFVVGTSKKQHTGQAALIAVFLLLAISLAAVFGVAGIALRERSAVAVGGKSNNAYFSAEAGLEDAFYRLNRGKQIGSSVTMTLDGSTVSTTITAVGNQRTIKSDGSNNGAVRSAQMVIFADPGASFSFALQAGSDGLSMGNNASIDGNVYSNGSINGANGTFITGWARVAGAANKIKDMEVYGNAYAHTLDDVKTRGDAYYQSIDAYSLNWVNNYDGGTAYPGSVDPPDQAFPITDEQIAAWKEIASTSRKTACSSSPYRPAASEIMWGLYECNVNIAGATTLYFKHPVWVKGSITIGQNVNWHIDPSAVGTSAVVIASGDTASSTSIGTIGTGNNFHTCGAAGYNSTTNKCNAANGSYPIFITTNSGTIPTPIALGQNPVGGAFFAPYGRFHTGNNIEVNAIAAKNLALTQNASIKYETGLAFVDFPTSVGGAWIISSWQEVQP